jgi:hypothetical protein
MNSIVSHKRRREMTAIRNCGSDVKKITYFGRKKECLTKNK